MHGIVEVRHDRNELLPCIEQEDSLVDGENDREEKTHKKPTVRRKNRQAQ